MVKISSNSEMMSRENSSNLVKLAWNDPKGFKSLLRESNNITCLAMGIADRKRMHSLSTIQSEYNIKSDNNF